MWVFFTGSTFDKFIKVIKNTFLIMRSQIKLIFFSESTFVDLSKFVRYKKNGTLYVCHTYDPGITV